MTEAESLFWATTLGAAIGVAAGTLIQFGATTLGSASVDQRQRTAFAKELGYNRQLVANMLEEIDRLRNAVNGHVLSNYVGFFPLNTAFWAQTQALMNSGKIYQWLSLDALQKLQKVSQTLSLGTSNFINGEITKRKDAHAAAPATFDQREAVQFVDWVQGQLRTTRTLLAEIAVAAGRNLDELK